MDNEEHNVGLVVIAVFVTLIVVGLVINCFPKWGSVDSQHPNYKPGDSWIEFPTEPQIQP